MFFWKEAFVQVLLCKLVLEFVVYIVHFLQFWIQVQLTNRRQLSMVYLTIRRRARGFYRLIVGEGRSPEPTIKGDRNRDRNRLYLSDWSMKQKNLFFHKFWYICAMMHAKSRALWQTAVYRSIDGTCVANQIARYAIVGRWGMLNSFIKNWIIV